MTAKELALLEKAKSAISDFCSPLINPGEVPTKPIGLGSGTFVIMGNQKGILTNAHVVNCMLQEKQNRFSVPDLDENLQELAYSLIIKFPPAANPNTEVGPDIAFILLDDQSYGVVTNKLKKQFWNIDQNTTINYDNENCLWMIWGNVWEGKEYKKISPRPILYLKNAGQYFVVPDLDNIEYKTWPLKHVKITVDNIISPIKTKEKTLNNFQGMSGAALWKIKLDDSGKVEKVFLMGLATEQKDRTLICRGPALLYQGFYPFTCGALHQWSLEH
ncbi:hypothetical protein K2W90_02695 [Candidatus Babeliales bacterium]|nr:hypothetical protein [Candidatus Babeliales bacterium]